jgi:hypothetical protein
MKPYKYQKEGILQMESFLEKTGGALLADDMGLGKRIICEENLVTPEGFTKMRDIKCGDKVIGCNGEPTTTIGVYPNGKQDVYAIDFSDGVSIECGPEHLWAVRDYNWKRYKKNHNNNGWYVLSVEDMLKRKPIKTHSKQPLFWIPRQKPTRHTKKPLPVDPYFIGVITGNGFYYGKNLYITLGNKDHESIGTNIPKPQRIKNTKGCKKYYYNAEMKYLFNKTGLYGKGVNKTIPEIYMVGSIHQRTELLRGLMDINGSCHRNRTVFHTHSKKLSYQVKQLVDSLGGYATICFHARNDLQETDIQVRMELDFCPFNIKRKSKKWKPKNRKRKRGIINIRYAGKKECQCIAVDSPDHLYLVGTGYVPTHNTIQTLWLLKRSKVSLMFPALIICPANVKYAWEHTALTHINTRAQVLEGRTPLPNTFGIIPKIIIINPDILINWLSFLLNINIKTLIFDECQYYKELAAIQTKAALTLARNIPYKIALSGTPLLNRPYELWPTLHMIQPENFPAFYSFGKAFCKPRKKYGKWEYKGADNIPELHKLLKKTCMVRRLKNEVIPDLPNKIRQVIPVKLTNEEEYKKANAHFTQWLRENYSGQNVEKALRAVAITKIGYLLRLSARLKCKAVIEWINRFLATYPDKKIVTYAIHHKMIHVLQKHINCKHITVDGSVIGRKRQYAVNKFRKDKNTKAFIGNIRAAGIAIDGLQEVCADMVFVEMYWRPGDHTQAEDRLYRVGQKKHVKITYLIAGGTIEETLCRIIQEKQKIIRGILDGGATPDDINVFDQLLKALNNESKKL